MSPLRIARLALEDGSVWHGRGFGAEGTCPGEVVFNTCLTGYQEILTDPSYTGQIVVMTAPHIGNTGTNGDDSEASRIFLNGFAVRELSPTVSSWRASNALSDWLAAYGRPGITGLDTRALTRRLRSVGSMKGVVSTDDALTDTHLIELARAWPGLDGVDLVQTVTCLHPYEWLMPIRSEWQQHQKSLQPLPGRPPHVVALDFGIKQNILRSLVSAGCRVTVVPARTTAAEVLARRPDGVLLSNGPGDPSALGYAVQTTRLLLGQVPILGICLGHQILGQAFGGRTYRLKFGHHGGNQPVRNLALDRVEISAHNHNFAVDPNSLPVSVEVTHVNLNDGCCEGFRSESQQVLSVQYHPEAAPGPHDGAGLFASFVRMMALPTPRLESAVAG